MERPAAERHHRREYLPQLDVRFVHECITSSANLKNSPSSPPAARFFLRAPQGAGLGRHGFTIDLCNCRSAFRKPRTTAMGRFSASPPAAPFPTAVSVAASEPFGSALRGSSTAGFRVRTVEPRCRFYWHGGGLWSTPDVVERVRRVPQPAAVGENRRGTAAARAFALRLRCPTLSTNGSSDAAALEQGSEDVIDTVP